MFVLGYQHLLPQTLTLLLLVMLYFSAAVLATLADTCGTLGYQQI